LKEPSAPKNLQLNVAEGIHRIEDAHTNWYLVEDGPRLTIVDTGLSRSWGSLHDALRALGRRFFEIEAVVVTHAHVDHMGFARRAQKEFGIPLWVHRAEADAVRHPLRYDHERARIPYLRHRSAVRVLTEMTMMGALWVMGTVPDSTLEAGDELDLPGRPRVAFTPGHTHGHCSLYYPDRGAVIVGDAFVMLEPYTGRHGPCLVARAATADSHQALSSLDTLAALDADVALTGHGPAWRGSLREAAERARAAGLS